MQKYKIDCSRRAFSLMFQIRVFFFFIIPVSVYNNVTRQDKCFHTKHWLTEWACARRKL